jgi:hypothetical protein
MTQTIAIALLNNQLKISHFNFSNPNKEIWHNGKCYTLKEIIKIAFMLK